MHDLMDVLAQLAAWDVSLIAQMRLTFDLSTPQGKLIADLYENNFHRTDLAATRDWFIQLGRKAPAFVGVTSFQAIVDEVGVPYPRLPAEDRLSHARAPLARTDRRAGRPGAHRRRSAGTATAIRDCRVLEIRLTHPRR